ncbi:hypothetical protein MOC27_16485 [Bacillus inaquosorum]|uniref:Uncharacterized protein n=1 Tax=Bacillus vallismortis TaxID=72361 RepID=A0AAP3FRK5_BACVA|nr:MULTISPECIES: hypothetical protein [Bacillus]MCY9234592.1 hypothetical protein [Bacillus spizizenii]MCY8247872.1 hypothetical protein [Bacillus inaquosorum]MCY8251305.1 hypothetical protein [Bacillus inaquosorum]MCY8315321.1 hypothetical protein [Bacillus vallismortis]MCY8706282.1 hypothetical protein [Bacillus inaquosorum]
MKAKLAMVGALKSIIQRGSYGVLKLSETFYIFLRRKNRGGVILWWI